MPQFSVIIPTHNRVGMLHRALASLEGQTFKDFEVILVDDGSTDSTQQLFNNFRYRHPDTWRYLLLPENKQRVIARNTGYLEATGQWLCTLDSDDLYVPFYFELLAQGIQQSPEAEIFNFGGLNVHKNYNITVNPVFKPEALPEGHEVFRSGKIATGHFIFKKSLLAEVNIPLTSNYREFAEEFKKNYPEVVPLYPRGEELGNPWGDDYAIFYSLTRKHHSVPLDLNLYMIWGRDPKELLT